MFLAHGCAAPDGASAFHWILLDCCMMASIAIVLGAPASVFYGVLLSGQTCVCLY